MVSPMKPPLPEEHGPAAPIDCPKCRAPMKGIRVGEVRVDRCYACEGLWLDALEKEKLLASGPAVKAADVGDVAKVEGHRAVAGVLVCPRDRSPLIGMCDLKQPHVKFESCTVCGGVFLDAGELRDLSEVTLRERLMGVVR